MIDMHKIIYIFIQTSIKALLKNENKQYDHRHICKTLNIWRNFYF